LTDTVLALIQQQSSPSRRFKIKTEPKKGKPEAEKRTMHEPSPKDDL
jgi:hypothetical protein